jgi:type IV secretory pathway VirB10-like protein
MEVDEEYLREVMAGSAAFPRREDTAQPSAAPSRTEASVKEEKEVVMQPAEAVEPREPAKPVRKKREALDYEAVFLRRKAGVLRRQTYISAALYEKINSFLPVIAGRLSITAYLDNILTHHLEQYRDDINELYERKSQKPF